MDNFTSIDQAVNIPTPTTYSQKPKKKVWLKQADWDASLDCKRAWLQAVNDEHELYASLYMTLESLIFQTDVNGVGSPSIATILGKRKTKVHRNTVGNHLRRLTEMGILVKSPGEYKDAPRHKTPPKRYALAHFAQEIPGPPDKPGDLNTKSVPNLNINTNRINNAYGGFKKPGRKTSGGGFMYSEKEVKRHSLDEKCERRLKDALSPSQAQDAIQALKRLKCPPWQKEHVLEHVIERKAKLAAKGTPVTNWGGFVVGTWKHFFGPGSQGDKALQMGQNSGLAHPQTYPGGKIMNYEAEQAYWDQKRNAEKQMQEVNRQKAREDEARTKQHNETMAARVKNSDTDEINSHLKDAARRLRMMRPSWMDKKHV